MRSKASAVLERPPQLGWRTTDEDEIALRRWRGRKGAQSEFWVAATPRRMAAAHVQQVLPPGWLAVSRGWRLNPKRAAELKMCPNAVRRLTRCPQLERGRIVAAP